MSDTSHIHTDDIIVDADEHFIIDTVTRAISSESNKKLTLMQYDHNCERYTFDIDRLVDGHDLMNCDRVQIHYVNIASNRQKYPGLYLVEDLHVNSSDKSKLTFTWLISNNGTMHEGSLGFLVSFECTNGDKILYRWSTNAFNGILITAGMDNNNTIIEMYADELLAWENYMHVTFIPDLVDKCYIEREFATEEEVAAIFDISNPDGVSPITIVPYEEVTAYVDEEISKLDSKYMPVKEIDNTPTDNSENLITSGGVKSYIDAQGSGFDLAMLPKYESKVLIDCSLRSALNGLVTFKIVSSSDFSIDWGDSSPIEIFETDTTQISHQYENVSFYGTITFYGNFNGLDAYNSANYVNYIIIAVEYGENISSITNFRGCQNLISFKSKYKGGSIQLGSQAFYACMKLVSFDCDSIISRSGGGQEFKSCTKLSYFPFDKLGEYYSFGSEMFYGCFTTKKSLDLLLPVYNTYTSSKAFASNTNLIDLKTNICYTQTYSGCTNLTNVELVDVGVGSNAFENCKNLKTVKIMQSSNETSIKTMSGSTGFGTNTNVETVFVRKDLLKAYKTGTNWVQYADKIYPHGGQYSEVITLPVANWVDNAQTVEVVGVTAEMRNVIEFILVDANGNQIEDTYDLSSTHGTMSMTFTCQTVPTEDIHVFIKSTLTNY